MSLRINDRTVEDEDETECIHGLALDIPCTICSGKDSSSNAKLEDVSMVFTAQYAGNCRACGDPIFPGNMIVYHSTLEYIHERCA